MHERMAEEAVRYPIHPSSTLAAQLFLVRSDVLEESKAGVNVRSPRRRIKSTSSLLLATSSRKLLLIEMRRAQTPDFWSWSKRAQLGSSHPETSRNRQARCPSLLSGRWFGLCFYDGAARNGRCPQHEKHESPDFSRGESQAIHPATMDKLGIASIISEDEEPETVKGIRRIWLDTTA